MYKYKAIVQYKKFKDEIIINADDILFAIVKVYSVTQYKGEVISITQLT